MHRGVVGDGVVDIALVHLVQVLFHDSDLVGHIRIAIERLVVGVGLIQPAGHLLHSGHHEDMQPGPVQQVVGRQERHLLSVVDEGQFETLLRDLEGRLTRVYLLLVLTILLYV